jgi:hypothetical protein
MNPNTMPVEVSKDISDELSKIDNKPNIPLVTNSNIIQMPIHTPVPKPVVVIQPSPPRRCIDCKCDILPHDAMWTDYCEPCLNKFGSEACRRHF